MLLKSVMSMIFGGGVQPYSAYCGRVNCVSAGCFRVQQWSYLGFRCWLKTYDSREMWVFADLRSGACCRCCFLHLVSWTRFLSSTLLDCFFLGSPIKTKQ